MLRSVHESLRPGDDEGLAIDFVREDRSVIKAVRDVLEPMWANHLPGTFVDYSPVVSTFVVKVPGPDSAMKLHHEPTFVAPPIRTFNIWIPLVDVTRELDNGILQLIPGTEKLDYGHVGFNTPVAFRPFERFLSDHLVGLDVRAGDAVIYDTRMLHASTPNRSDRHRPAIAAALAPTEAPLIHTVASGARSRVVYRVDRQFFLNLHPSSVAEEISASYPVLEEFEQCKVLSPAQIAEAVGSSEPPVPEVLLPGDLDGPHPVTSWSDRATDVDVAEFCEGMESSASTVRSSDGLVIDRSSGRLSARTVVRSWRSTEGRRSTPVLRSGVVRRPRDSVIVRLGAGARTEVRLSWRRGGELSVLDAPFLGSGCTAEGGSGDRRGAWQFRAGRTVHVAAGEHLRVWNEGPGDAVLLFWRAV